MKAFFFLVIILFTLGQENKKFVDGSPKKFKPSSSKTHNVERIKITASPKDRRSYRGLKLKNDFKVVLVHDASAKNSAASLVIGVGGLNDFPDSPGIANLTAFSLIKGSKKYTMPYDLTQYVTFKGAGSTELPVIRPSDQIFSFDVKHFRLEGALDRFAHLFIDPLFYHSPSEMLKDPINFIQFQYDRLRKFDEYRIAEVEKSKPVCKRNHPFCHFFLGNRNIFYGNSNEVERRALLHQKVHKFHSLWYSSNLMTLAVLGRESLDELEEMVVPLFEKIENKGRKKLVFPYTHHPLGSEQLKKKIYIVPTNNVRLMRLWFPIPDVSLQYRTAPDYYISSLMVDPGLGGISSELERMNFGKTLEIKFRYQNGISFFIIQVELTDCGVEHSNEVINLFFQYIHLLRENGVQEWIFDEHKQIAEQLFNDWPSNDSGSLAYTEILAYSMQMYPMEDILTQPYIRDKWNPSFIKCFLSYLRPDNMNVSIVSKSVGKFADLVEPSYGTKYGIEQIPNSLIQKWSTKNSKHKLKLPFFGNYMVQDFVDNSDLYSTEEHEPEIPIIIYESQTSEIWFMRDDDFEIHHPMLCLTFEIISAMSRDGPGQRILYYLYYTILMASLKKKLNEEVLFPGLKWDITMDAINLKVTLSGPNEKVQVLLEKILLTLNHFQSEIADDIESMKSVLRQQSRATRLSFAENHRVVLNWYLYYLQSNHGWTIDNTAIDTERMLQQLNIRKFLTKIFRRVFIRAFIHGNYMEKQEAMQIANLIDKSFRSSSGLLLQEILRPRAVEIAEGSHFIFQMLNEKPDIYAQVTRFQVVDLSGNLRNKILGLMFDHTVRETCQRILSERSKLKSDVVQQVECLLVEVHGTKGYNLGMLTAIKDAGNVNRKIEIFLRDVLDVVQSFSDDYIKKVKTQVATTELKTASNLKEISQQYWSEITNRYYNFDRNKMELELLDSIQKKDLVTYFKEMISQRRQLTISVFPTDVESSWPSAIPRGAIKIEDVEAFKSSMNLLPYNFSPVPASGMKQ